MIRLEFLLEEQSMQHVLAHILSRLSPDPSRCTWRLHPHGGKQNLLRRLPQLLRGYANWITADWVTDEYRIIVIVDCDQDECNELKRRILAHCADERLSGKVTARIAIVALESWFLGDPEALEVAFPKLRRRRLGGNATYRQPDSRPDPARDLDREMREAGYAGGYRKIAHSDEIAPRLSLTDDHNRSHSFNVTLQTLKTLLSA